MGADSYSESEASYLMRCSIYNVNSNLYKQYYRYRHKNLFDLMGICQTPLALVLEFMEEGSLSDHLHKKVYLPMKRDPVLNAFFRKESPYTHGNSEAK